jgi:hypothetical protein
MAAAATGQARAAKASALTDPRIWTENVVRERRAREHWEKGHGTLFRQAALMERKHSQIIDPERSAESPSMSESFTQKRFASKAPLLSSQVIGHVVLLSGPSTDAQTQQQRPDARARRDYDRPWLQSPDLVKKVFSEPRRHGPSTRDSLSSTISMGYGSNPAHGIAPTAPGYAALAATTPAPQLPIVPARTTLSDAAAAVTLARASEASLQREALAAAQTSIASAPTPATTAQTAPSTATLGGRKTDALNVSTRRGGSACPRARVTQLEGPSAHRRIRSEFNPAMQW